MTEKEKMQTGLWFNANFDPALCAEREQTAELCQALNSTPYTSKESRKILLARLLPGLSEKAGLLSPFQCDYGFNITIGEGRPKICVPIVGQTEEDILREAAGFASLPVDVVEWRADWFQDVFDTEKVLHTAKALRSALGELPLLFTFRTAKEGGEKESLQKIESHAGSQWFRGSHRCGTLLRRRAGKRTHPGGTQPWSKSHCFQS